jgi:hypothetical protein
MQEDDENNENPRGRESHGNTSVQYVFLNILLTTAIDRYRP